MDIDNPQPVRFRVVLELTFPDADPWDADYENLLDQMKEGLESTPSVNCRQVLIREAERIGPEDNYEDWRGGWKYDFSSLSPNFGFLIGAKYPVVAVDPLDLAKVWELMSKAEAGKLKDVNVAIAIGQILRPESNAGATIARVSILRALQSRKAVPASEAIFEKAASFPLDSPPENQADLDSIAHFFQDHLSE